MTKRKKPAPVPTEQEVEAYARNEVEQWDKHDRFRVTSADEAHLVHGKPMSVWLAEAYLVARDEIGRYEADEYSRHIARSSGMYED